MRTLRPATQSIPRQCAAFRNGRWHTQACVIGCVTAKLGRAAGKVGGRLMRRLVTRPSASRADVSNSDLRDIPLSTAFLLHDTWGGFATVQRQGALVAVHWSTRRYFCQELSSLLCPPASQSFRTGPREAARQALSFETSEKCRDNRANNRVQSSESSNVSVLRASIHEAERLSARARQPFEPKQRSLLTGLIRAKSCCVDAVKAEREWSFPKVKHFSCYL